MYTFLNYKKLSQDKFPLVPFDIQYIVNIGFIDSVELRLELEPNFCTLPGIFSVVPSEMTGYDLILEAILCYNCLSRIFF